MNTKAEKEKLVTEIKANTKQFILLAEKIIQYKDREYLTDEEKVDYYCTATSFATIQRQGDDLAIKLMALLV
jgi:hypothetical protein